MSEKISNSSKDAAAKEDAAQQVDLDLGMALERIDSWVDAGIRMLPNIVLAVILLIIVYIVSLTTAKFVKAQFTGRGRQNLGEMLGSFAKWAILLIGFLFAATIVIPTLNPGDLIAGLGVSSVAIGFAFKDILQNWLAGLLILIRQPFQIGDQIEVQGHEGTVEHIETRATIIKTYDSQRIVVPNSTIYTNAVIVRSAYETRRDQYDVGIGYDDDIDKACEVIREALKSIPEVKSDPEPVIVPWDLAASWVTIRIQWWRDTKQNGLLIHASVVKAIKLALDKAQIDMPYTTQVQLLHDKTESTKEEPESPRKNPIDSQEASQS